MSDRQDPWAPGGDWPSSPPPPPPPAPPVELDGPIATDTTEVRSGGVGARIVAIGVGASLLLGGGAFAATQMGGTGGGESAQAAVEELFDALGDEDLLGMLAALDPGERDTLRQPTEQLFEELERMEVVDDFDLDGVPGIDLEFDGLTFRTEEILPGLERVYLTGGTASFAVDGAELPVGDFLADTFDRFGVDHASFREEEADEPVGSDETFLVARETDDGWRVSLGYTAAEAARIASGRPVPATGMAPIGSESPAAAVEGFLRAATELDVRGLVGRLSPDEARALHHYWPVLVDEADLPTSDDLDADVTLTDLELDADEDGDRAVVSIRSIGLDVVADDFVGGGTYADGCVSLRGDALDEVREGLETDFDHQLAGDSICLDDLEEIFEDAMAELEGSGIDGFSGAFPGFGDDVPTFGITTTRVDGEWYIAPIRTGADLGISALRLIDREDLEAAVDAVEDFFGEGFFSGGSVGGGFVPPGLEDLDDLDSLDDLDDLGSSSETFEEVGEPIDPGAPTTEARTSALVEELIFMFSGDEQVTACVLVELDATAQPGQLEELADAYAYDFEPSPEVQDLLFSALEACGG
ncbi:MAG: hypothetical protein ACLGIC_06725 [Acidimicrobiia bacterium]